MIRADYIILAALLLMLSSHSITQYLIAKYTTVSDIIDSGKAIIAAGEQNPLSALLLGFDKMRFVYSFVLMPAFLIGIYWFFRKKYYGNHEVLEGFAVTTFMVFMINFFNDASYLMGFLAK